jgi:isopentenyl diphosphate isomerase/L-lactate dehydrogenase-like FMN-dependent dehydrogenase
MQLEYPQIDDTLATETSRRSLLRFLLGSPLLLSWRVLAAERLLAGISPGEASAEATQEFIARAADGMDVFDFRAVAERDLLPAHYTFLSMGIHDEFTLKANREGFAKFRLRPRRLIDVRDVNTSTELLGAKLSCPILLAPAGGQRAFHPDGEVAVARAAKRKDHLQILSTGSSASLDEVVEAREAAIWFQLYTPRVWPVTRRQLKHAERAGCPAVVLTVDAAGAMGQNDLDRIRRFHRAGRADDPVCQACHSLRSQAERALLGAVGVADAAGFDLVDALSDVMVLNWDFVDRIRDATPMKLIIKGILTHEDASLCVEHGVDGLIVSNHGGRSEDSGLSTIEVLAEVVEAVAGRIPVLIDGGFRRGTDVFKAVALGASAVCVGRPYLWGLSAFGQEGVEAVLAILRREFEIIMRQMGTPTVKAITTAHVRGPTVAGAP